MADGEVIFKVELDNKDLHKELNKTARNIESLDSKISKLGAQKIPLEDKLAKIGAELDEAKAVLFDMKSAPRGTYEKIDISEQAQRVSMLQSEFNRTASSVESINNKLSTANIDLEEARNRAQELSGSIEEAELSTSRFGDATAIANAKMEKLFIRVSKLAQRVFVFTVITAALRSVRSWMSNVIKTSDEATSAIAQFKGALLTLAQPLVEVIIPAITTLVRVLSAVVTQIARVVAMISGKSIEATAENAKALNDEANAIKGTGNAAKKASKSLAAFDEINQLSSTETAGGGAALSEIAPDFSFMDNVSDRLNNIAKAVMAIAAGLALWKLSSILPAQLANVLKLLAGILIAIGGVILMWDGLTDAWNNGVNWKNLIEMLAGSALAALGLYIAFGKIGAGIALVIGGAAMIVTSFKDIIENGANLQNTLLLIAGIVATGLGFFFLTGSVVPLVIAGIAAIIAAILNITGNLEEFAKNLKENILGGIIQFIKGVFAGDWESAWEGIKKVFKGIWNSIVIIVESAINFIIKGLNWLINKINTIQFTVPSWVPGVGGKSIGAHLSPLSEVRIPRLATGAVIPPNREFMAVLGDQKSGTNIETPLATMVDAFKQAMSEYGGGTTTVVLQLDGKEIARSTVKNINNMTRAAGKPVLLY